MNVLLYDATDFSGGVVLKTLLNKDHKVTAITRNKSSIITNHKHLILKEGNILNPQFIQEA